MSGGGARSVADGATTPTSKPVLLDADPRHLLAEGCDLPDVVGLLDLRRRHLPVRLLHEDDRRVLVAARRREVLPLRLAGGVALVVDHDHGHEVLVVLQRLPVPVRGTVHVLPARVPLGGLDRWPALLRRGFVPLAGALAAFRIEPLAPKPCRLGFRREDLLEAPAVDVDGVVGAADVRRDDHVSLAAADGAHVGRRESSSAGTEGK